MIRRITAAIVVLGLLLYVAESYLGTCGIGSDVCIQDPNVLLQPFTYGTIGSFQNSYYAPFVYAIVGLVSALAGVVTLAADFVRRRVALPTSGKLVALAGWSLVAVGLAAFVVSLSESYICMEYCFNVNNSFVTEWGGIIAALAGLTLVASAVLASQFRPAVRHRLGRWALVAVIVALMASTLWTASTAYSTYVFDSNPTNFNLNTVYESSTYSILGSSGFQVTRQYTNPSTWTFELASGSTGLVYFEYNVTKGLDLFLGALKEPLSWTIWQVLPNGTNILAEINGSTVTRVRSFVTGSNQPQIEVPLQSYALGVQLGLTGYAVRGNLVNVTWSLRGLVPGSYPVQASDLDWLTFNVTSASGPPLNTTSETFPGNCDG